MFIVVTNYPFIRSLQQCNKNNVKIISVEKEAKGNKVYTVRDRRCNHLERPDSKLSSVFILKNCLIDFKHQDRTILTIRCSVLCE